MIFREVLCNVKLVKIKFLTALTAASTSQSCMKKCSEAPSTHALPFRLGFSILFFLIGWKIRYICYQVFQEVKLIFWCNTSLSVDSKIIIITCLTTNLKFLLGLTLYLHQVPYFSCSLNWEWNEKKLWTVMVNTMHQMRLTMHYYSMICTRVHTLPSWTNFCSKIWVKNTKSTFTT